MFFLIFLLKTTIMVMWSKIVGSFSFYNVFCFAFFLYLIISILLIIESSSSFEQFLYYAYGMVLLGFGYANKKCRLT